MGIFFIWSHQRCDNILRAWKRNCKSGKLNCAQYIPSSPRSRSVTTKLTPLLVKQLDKQGFQFGAPIFIRIYKKEKQLQLFLKDGEKFRLFRSYPICYFSGSLGPKLKEGDQQSPEGFYFVRPSQLNPNSQFHLSFNLGYPNRYDRAHRRSGSALMVHGNCVSIGCYAMTDPVIEEIYTLVEAAFRKGQKFFRVHAFPFAMTEENMQRFSDPEWQSFWHNLKQGYDFFEQNGIPPNVTVKSKAYYFGTD